jgi:hypothetical protein
VGGRTLAFEASYQVRRSERLLDEIEVRGNDGVDANFWLHKAFVSVKRNSEWLSARRYPANGQRCAGFRRLGQPVAALVRDAALQI